VERWVGKTVDAVVEGKTAPFLKALTDNYLRLQIREPEMENAPPHGGESRRLRCRIVEYLGSDCVDAAGEMLV
jgi:hypothetical protein